MRTHVGDMESPLHLVCPQCDQLNRLPPARLRAGPRCGRCKTALLPAAPHVLDDTNAARYLDRNDLPVVVDFWAPWCAPCRGMAPAFAALATRCVGEVLCAKLDTDRAPQTAAVHAIRSIPTLIVFRRGREIARHSGALPAAELERFVRTALAPRAST